MVVAQGLIAALPGLIDHQCECADDILGQLANSTSGEGLTVLSTFRKELAKVNGKKQAIIMDFVMREENGGWLDGRRKGVIRPSDV